MPMDLFQRIDVRLGKPPPGFFVRIERGRAPMKSYQKRKAGLRLQSGGLFPQKRIINKGRVFLNRHKPAEGQRGASQRGTDRRSEVPDRRSEGPMRYRAGATRIRRLGRAEPCRSVYQRKDRVCAKPTMHTVGTLSDAIAQQKKPRVGLRGFAAIIRPNRRLAAFAYLYVTPS